MPSAPSAIRRFLVASLILISCIGCDQATKNLATRSLRDAPAQVLLAGTVRLEYALNPGGFLSLGHNFPESVRSWLFVSFNIATMLALGGILIVRRQMDWKLFVSLSYILAGGIGNLIDRICNDGLVTDFLNVGIGPLRTGIFNVADMAVMFGGIALVYLSCRPETPHSTSNPHPAMATGSGEEMSAESTTDSIADDRSCSS